MTSALSRWLIGCVAVALLVVPLAVILVDIGRSRIVDGLTVVVESPSTRADVAAGEIGQGLTVGQSFRARDDLLQAVAVHVATFGGTNNAPVLFSLREYPQGTRPVRTATAEAQTLVDNTFYYFRFTPIERSAGKRYVFTLEAPEATKGNAVSVWVGDCDCYADGSLLLNGENHEGREADFRLSYRVQADSAMEELLNRMSQYKPWFFKGAFIAALGALSLGLITLAAGSFAYESPTSARRMSGLLMLAPWLAVLALTLVLVVR